MLSRLQNAQLLIGPTTIIIKLIMLMMMAMLMLLTQNVNGKPQDPSIIEGIASQAIAFGGNMAEMIGDAGLISKNIGFQIPFGQVNSNTVIGPGKAFRNDEDESSEEDGRRKRSLKTEFDYDYLLGEEMLLAEPHNHRGKRSPCHKGGGGGYGGGGGGTGGTGGGGNMGGIDYGGGDVPVDGADYDLAERRRRARRRRQMAARKKARAQKNTRKTTGTRRKTSKLVADNDNAKPVVTRRKRQTELDDLNQNMSSASKDFSQHAQQFADQINSIFQNIMNSMTNMAQKLKQKFGGQNMTNTDTDTEI